MTTKREITNELNRLKDFGFTIVTFNDSRPLRSAQKNFVDHLIFNRKYIIFVEVKIGKDKLSEGQKIIGEKLSACSIFNKNTFMKYVKSVEDAKRLVERALKGDL